MTLPTATITGGKPPNITFHPTCVRPGFMESVIDDIANGAQVLELCSRHKIKYSDLLTYIHYDPVRDKQFTQACKQGEAWLIARLSQEIHGIGLVDIADAFNADGSVREISDMPEALRHTIASIEVLEVFEFDGRSKSKVQTGVIKKIKLNDKLKAIEMLGKKLKMFIDEVHITGSVQVTHHVEKYDLEERIAMLRNTKPLPLAIQQAIPCETVEEAMIINKPGEDI